MCRILSVLFLVVLLAACGGCSQPAHALALEAAVAVLGADLQSSAAVATATTAPTSTATPVSPAPTFTRVPPAATSTPVRPAPTPQPFAIKDTAFEADYTGDCATDALIKGVDGTSFDVSGTVSMRDGRFTLWCWGAKHTWLGTLTYAGYTFASDKAAPLQFAVTANRGYLYTGGKGTVTLPDGSRVILPPGVAPAPSARTPTVTPVPPVTIRLSAGKYGSPLWLEVVAGAYKLQGGTTLRTGSALGVQEDQLTFPPSLLINVGEGPVVLKGKSLAQGTSFTVDAAGNLQPGASSATPAGSPPGASTPQATVKTANLNIRGGPGTNYPVVGAAHQGDNLPVIGQAGGCAWLKVRRSGGEGWVIGGAQYVTLNVPCLTVPAAAVPPTPVPPPAVPAAVAPGSAGPCTICGLHGLPSW